MVDVAHQIPARITFWMLDVPEDKWDRLAHLEHNTVTSSDPEFTDGRTPGEAAAAAGTEIHMYFAELIQARMQDLDGRTDILSEFLRGQIDGEPLGWIQVVAEAGLILAGGLDTTRAAASAGAMLPLLERPDQLAVLMDDPGLLPGAVEEFVRWASPITSESRTVAQATTLAGHELAEGDRVVVWGPSCNRDEQHFEDPYRFDIRRQPNRHLGFSYGRALLPRRPPRPDDPSGRVRGAVRPLLGHRADRRAGPGALELRRGPQAPPRAPHAPLTGWSIAGTTAPGTVRTRVRRRRRAAGSPRTRQPRRVRWSARR